MDLLLSAKHALAANPHLFSTLWIALTLAVNLLFSRESAQGIVTWLGGRKWGARLLAAMKHMGADPIGYLNALDSYFKSNPPPPPLAGAPAYARPAIPPPARLPRASTPLALAAGVMLVGCGLITALSPSVVTLGECIATYVEQHPGADFESYVVNVAFACGGDVAAVLEAIIASADPSLAPFKAEAKAVHADGAKLKALDGRVAAKRASK